jgi:hypothetical protein
MQVKFKHLLLATTILSSCKGIERLSELERLAIHDAKVSMFLNSDSIFFLKGSDKSEPICTLPSGQYDLRSKVRVNDFYQVTLAAKIPGCDVAFGYIKSEEIDDFEKSLTVFETTVPLYILANDAAKSACEISRGFYQSDYKIDEIDGFYRILFDAEFFEDYDRSSPCNIFRQNWAFIKKSDYGMLGGVGIPSASHGIHMLNIAVEGAEFVQFPNSVSRCILPRGNYQLAAPLLHDIDQDSSFFRVQLSESAEAQIQELLDSRSVSAQQFGCNTNSNWDFRIGYVLFRQTTAIPMGFNLSNTPAPKENPDFAWPLQDWNFTTNAREPWTGRISSEWCECRSIGTSPHIGVDFATEAEPKKVPERWSVAIRDGTVENISKIAACGFRVDFRDTTGILWRYIHMEDPAKRKGGPLKVNAFLKKGERIGHHWSWPTKRCGNGPHLHFERLSAIGASEKATLKICTKGKKKLAPRDCKFDPFFPWRSK